MAKHKGKTVAEWYCIVDDRATKLVRAHVRGRRPIADKAERQRLHAARDRAFDRLVNAVLDRDRARELMDAEIAQWTKRSQAAKRGHRRRHARELASRRTKPEER